MQNTIPKLVKIVKEAKSEKAADHAIQKEFNQLNGKIASFIRQDIQDFIEEDMTEKQLSYNLAEFGI